MSEFRTIGSFAKQLKRVNESNSSGADVYSVTKYDGFVRSLDYFKKQVFSRDLSSYKIVKKGEFAYSTIHLDEGALGLLGDEEALISPMYTTFGVDASVERQYLAYLLKSPNLINQYGLIGQGSVNRRKSVSFSSLAELEVFIPPLPEQKKIAEILSGIDTAIMLLDAKISKLNLAKSSVSEKEFAPATFLQTEASGSENSLQKKTLREVADVIDCKHRTPSYASEGFPVVRPRDVKESGINFDQCIKTSADELNSLNDGINPQINDIVYSRNATLGVGALVRNKVIFAIGQDVCILRSKAINPKYFYYQLNSASFFRQVENLVSGSTFKRINLGAIRELQVITPDTSGQARVASTLERIDNSIASLQRRREKNTQLKTSLAQDLLSGRKRVSI